MKLFKTLPMVGLGFLAAASPAAAKVQSTRELINDCDTVTKALKHHSELLEAANQKPKINQDDFKRLQQTQEEALNLSGQLEQDLNDTGSYLSKVCMPIVEINRDPNNPSRFIWPPDKKEGEKLIACSSALKEYKEHKEELEACLEDSNKVKEKLGSQPFPAAPPRSRPSRRAEL